MSGSKATGSFIRTDESLYGYVPSMAVTAIFVILSLASTIIHCGQSVKYRKWYLIYTAGICGVLELTGWIGRLWSAFSPQSLTAFKVQASCLIFAPTTLLAVNFVILGQIIKRLGPDYSRLPPKKDTIVFCTCDVLALFVQSGGGVIAASASNNADRANLGGRIMLVGIVLQLVVIIGFSTLATEFFIRYYKNTPIQERGIPAQKLNKNDVHGRLTRNIKWMLGGLLLSTVFFLVRSVYRVVEFSDGWDGIFMHTQIYFNIMDGLMIALAMFMINVFHPGRLLPVQEQRTLELDYMSV